MQRLPPTTGTLHRYPLLTSQKSNDKMQTKQTLSLPSPKQQQQNNPNQTKTHAQPSESKTPLVTSFSVMQTLGVCWTDAVLCSKFVFFFPPYICCFFSQKVPKVARGKKFRNYSFLSATAYNYWGFARGAYVCTHRSCLCVAVDVPHLKGPFVRKLFIHQSCRYKENKYLWGN